MMPVLPTESHCWCSARDWHLPVDSLQHASLAWDLSQTLVTSPAVVLGDCFYAPVADGRYVANLFPSLVISRSEEGVGGMPHRTRQ